MPSAGYGTRSVPTTLVTAIWRFAFSDVFVVLSSLTSFPQAPPAPTRVAGPAFTGPDEKNETKDFPFRASLVGCGTIAVASEGLIEKTHSVRKGVR